MNPLDPKHLLYSVALKNQNFYPHMSTRTFEERQILELKIYESTFYFKVKWDDGSISWTRQTHLSAKNKVLDYLRLILKNLRNKKKAENDRQNELELEAYKESLIKKPKYDTYFDENKKEPTQLSSIKKEIDFQKASVEKKESNFFDICEGAKILARMKFFKTQSGFSDKFNVEDCFVIDFKKMLSILHVLNLENLVNKYVCEINKDEYSNEYLHKLLGNTPFCILAKNNKGVCLLVMNDKKSNFLQKNPNFGVLYEISGCNNYFSCFKKINCSSVFNHDKFGVFTSTSLASFFDMKGIQTNALDSFVVNNKRVYTGKKLEYFAQKNFSLSKSSSEAKLLFVDQWFSNVINSVIAAQDGGNITNKQIVFSQNERSFKQICKGNGMIILTKEFLMYGNLDFMVKLGAFIIANDSWKICCLKSGYNTFKERLHDLTKLDKDKKKYKPFYTLLKSNIVKEFEIDDPHILKTTLESMWAKTHLLLKT